MIIKQKVKNLKLKTLNNFLISEKIKIKNS